MYIPQRQHAIVIGGSIAGLLTARVLSTYFDRVTILERDQLPNGPYGRKGVPQGHHGHVLLVKGLQIMESYFPGLTSQLLAAGAVMEDTAATIRWHVAGGYRVNYASDLSIIQMSRPLLEETIRAQVALLTNVTIQDQTRVLNLQATESNQTITGVEILYEDERTSIDADLVVDATGRGSLIKRWLAVLGYRRPDVSEVQVNMRYATRFYRRTETTPSLLMISPEPPQTPSHGYVGAIENDQFVVTMSGREDNLPTRDEADFLPFAQGLAAPDIYQILAQSEPLTDVNIYNFTKSRRAHFEKLKFFPSGLLVIGDAISSFNPIYGQGMTSAAAQTQALDKLLATSADDTMLWRAFFKEAAKVVDVFWQIAVGQDFTFTNTVGKKAPETNLVNAYTGLVDKASHHDPVVCDALMHVMNMLAPPTALFKPNVLWRVMKHAALARVRPRELPNVDLCRAGLNS